MQVDYSDLNFKDGTPKNGKIIKEFPHIPGIDFSELYQRVKIQNLKKEMK